jgi:hypothetical protein
VTPEPVQPAEEVVSKADYEKLLNQLRGNDRQRQELQNQLQQIRDKDLPEAEKLKRDAEAIKAENERLKADLQKRVVENAFLKDNTVKWHDPSAALRLADMSQVVVDDDGTVSGLKKALEDLAKANPWMIDKGTPESTPPAGAPPMNGGGSASSGNADMKKLEGRIPALASRRRRPTT